VILLFIYLSVNFVFKIGGFFSPKTGSRPRRGLGAVFGGFKKQAALPSGQRCQQAVE